MICDSPSSECGGFCCEDYDIAARADMTDKLFVGIKAYALNSDEAGRLWNLSSELIQSGAP